MDTIALKRDKLEYNFRVSLKGLGEFIHKHKLTERDSIELNKDAFAVLENEYREVRRRGFGYPFFFFKVRIICDASRIGSSFNRIVVGKNDKDRSEGDYKESEAYQIDEKEKYDWRFWLNIGN